MTILRKILAVTLCALVIVSIAVVPCFAWEWNGNTTGKLTSPIAPIEYSYIAGSPTFGDMSHSTNSFTSKGNMLTLALPDTFNANSIETQGDGTSSISVYGSKEMLYVDKDTAVATVQSIWDKEYGTGGYHKLRQFAGCTDVAQIQYTYGSLTSPFRYIAERVGTFGTHTALLPWILNYQTYNLVSDPETNGLTAYVYLKYRTDEGNWYNDVFIYEGYDTRYTIENDTRDYYQYNCNIGTALKQFVESRVNYDGQQPFIIVDSMYIGNTSDNGAFRAIRSNNLVGVHETFAGSGSAADPTMFSINGYGGNMIANMLWSGYVSNTEIPANAIPPELGNATSFLSTALGGFLNFSLIPGITLGGILTTCICIALFLTFLKIFAGG